MLSVAARPRWTLRRRLVVVVVALVAVVAAAMGTLSTLALQTSLTTQLDEKLTAAAPAHGRRARPLGSRAAGEAFGAVAAAAPARPARPGRRHGRPSSSPRARDPADLTIDQAYYIADDGTPTALDDAQIAQLLAVPTDGEPVARHAQRTSAATARSRARPRTAVPPSPPCRPRP